jgi:hypothetical protein
MGCLDADVGLNQGHRIALNTMPIVAELIELQTHREAATLRLSNVEKFKDGSGYRCDLAVRSGGFVCEQAFRFHDQHLAEAIKSIREMIGGLPGEAVLKELWEKDFIQFKMNRLGHVVVSGELFDYRELPQSIKFAFRTDQTVFGPLLRDLTAIHEARP